MTGAAVDARERLIFDRDIRPRLSNVPERQRRARGLRLWLQSRRDREDGRIWPGQAWIRAVQLARWLVFLTSIVAGGGLAWGLTLSGGQRVHVVIFFALTVVVPWAIFIALTLLRTLALRRGNAGMPWLFRTLLQPLVVRLVGEHDLTVWEQAFGQSRGARQALAARASGLLQWGGLGFTLGVALAFLICLSIFDVRFYWEATPDSTTLMVGAVSALSTPWHGFWQAGVPGEAVIEATRLLAGQESPIPGGSAAGAWWRFLLMTVLVWGCLPRLLLVGLFTWRERRALERLDFQAPAHRRLWRALAGVTRGQAAAASTDGALVLDVGGHGIDGMAIRGFLLRRLRLNPERNGRVNVLDKAAEDAANQGLGQETRHIVLIGVDRDLSPRATRRLQQRVRSLAGSAVPVTWVIVADDNGSPENPDPDGTQRWTRLIDGLRDPNTDIVAYDSAA